MPWLQEHLRLDKLGATLIEMSHFGHINSNTG